MKYFIITIALCSFLSCSTKENKNDEKILKHLKKKSLGMINNQKIYNTKEINDTLLSSTYEFYNPILKHDVKCESFFTVNDTMVIKEDVQKFYNKEKGEFVLNKFMSK